jgi:hypothetical protein
MRLIWGAWLLPVGLSMSIPPVGGADRPRVEAESPPRPFLTEAGREDGTIEASAVEPIGDGRLFLVAHDKEPGLVVVDARDGRRVGDPLLLPGVRDDPSDGPKWEGMALDSDGNYYVIGSHSGDAEERLRRSFLVRFRLTGGAGEPLLIERSSVVHWTIAETLASALRKLGLDEGAVERRKIEGLAVREVGGRRELVIGLREPDDRVRAFAAGISPAPADGESLELRPLFAFSPGERGGVRLTLTELEHVPDLGGFLVVTATEDDANRFHGNVLWLVTDADAEGFEVAASPLREFEPSQKAEGLCRLPGERFRLLVTFDNDAQKSGVPSRWQTLLVEPSGR